MSDNTIRTNITGPAGFIETFPASRSNNITKAYYDFLVGEINRGAIRNKVVCRKEHLAHGHVSYYLISQY